MKLKLVFGALASAVTLVLQCHSQIIAPTSLPPCLIQYSCYNEFNHTSASRLLLYNSSQTYVEINSYYTNAFTYAGHPAQGTNATNTGTFTYAVDPQNPAHATIAYNGGTGSDQLYFGAANSGLQTPTPVLDSGAGFTLYPSQVTNGGSNCSNLCQLAAGGTATTGFVVQSGGPRWVLLRAVGTSLGNFGVSPAVASPSFTLYNSTQTVVGTSSVWSSDPNLVSGYQTIFSLVGAFPLNSGSDEGVLVVPLNPGAYTASVNGAGAGKILCEVYVLPF